ncbi:MAG: ZIP family metal transporter [Kamptonema sp. SIO4C4]|nr:ZIP family metal transporter [Kamptonema sp. SIO4C4]
MNLILIGSLASLAAGLGTGVGAIPIFFTTNFTQRFQNILLGFGGGVMLAATAFSLIVPGIESAQKQGLSEITAAAIAVSGIMMGGFAIWFIHNAFPHEHFNKGPEQGLIKAEFKRIWLFVIAIALHNFPEGLAVGVGVGTGDMASGTTLAIGIGLQNIPEGLVLALALRNLQYTMLYAFGISLLTGLVEPFGGILGVSVVSVAQSLLPWGMAFAAGAMLFVIVGEIIPEIDEQGWEQEGTFGVMAGFVTMMFLDVVLG